MYPTGKGSSQLFHRHVIFYFLETICDQVKLVMSRNYAGGSGEVQIVKNNPEEGGLVGSDEAVRCAVSVL